VAGEGGPGRAAWVQEALHQQFADIGLSVNPAKITIGSLYDGFDFPQRDSRCHVQDGPQSSDRPDGSGWCRSGALVRRTQYLRRADADGGEIGSDAFDQLMHFADWWTGPSTRPRSMNTSSGRRSGGGDDEPDYPKGFVCEPSYFLGQWCSLTFF
jgi:hypothetical protein